MSPGDGLFGRPVANTVDDNDIRLENEKIMSLAVAVALFPPLSLSAYCIMDRRCIGQYGREREILPAYADNRLFPLYTRSSYEITRPRTSMNLKRKRVL